MTLESRNLRDTDELVTRMAVRMGCQVRIKSGYEVESMPFDELLEETEPLPINELQDPLRAAVHVWTAQLAVEPMND